MAAVNTLLIERLETIGLTGKEAEVYIGLLKLGEVPVRDLVQATENHPQLVYWALEKLQERNLVSVTHRRHRKYVRAEDPRLLEKLEQTRLDRLKQVMPELLALQTPVPGTNIKVSGGPEAIRSARMAILTKLKAGEIESVIGGGGDRYYEIMGDQFAEFERKRIKLGIGKQVVSYADQRVPHTENAEQFTELAEYRSLPQSFAALTTTSIYADIVNIYLWSTDPAVITIESPEIATSYQQYFQTLWQIATK